MNSSSSAVSESRRAAYQRIAARWDGPRAASQYSDFCRANGIDIDVMHWKHAISWDMLESLRHDPLVELGAHTVNHARISSLSAPDAIAELRGSRERLRRRLGVQSQRCAFPYGRSGDCGVREFALAEQAGFVSAATTSKGLIHRGQNAFGFPRNTLNGAHRSLAMMLMHLTGLTGAAARMTGRLAAGACASCPLHTRLSAGMPPGCGIISSRHGMTSICISSCRRNGNNSAAPLWPIPLIA